jgi:hypothetical protein
MQVGRRDQDLALLGWEDGSDLLGLPDDALDVCPAVAQRR